jgi:hypothetical protein
MEKTIMAKMISRERSSAVMSLRTTAKVAWKKFVIGEEREESREQRAEGGRQKAESVVQYAVSNT